jgi:hypothetical protein
MAGIMRLDDTPVSRTFRDGVEVAPESVEAVQSVSNMDVETTPYAASTALAEPRNLDGTYTTVIPQADLDLDMSFLQDKPVPAPVVDTNELWPDPPTIDEREAAEADDAGAYVSEPTEDGDDEVAIAANHGPGDGRDVLVEDDGAGNFVVHGIPHYLAGLVEFPVLQEKVSRAVYALGKLKLTKEQITGAMRWYFDTTAADLRQMVSERDDRHRQQRRETRAELIAEHGDNAQLNVTLDAIESLLQDPLHFPNGEGEMIVGAEYNGQRIINNPAIANFLAKMARRTGYATEEATTKILAEIAKLEEQRDNDIQEHQWKRMWGPDRTMTGSERWLELQRKLERQRAA